MLHGYGVDALNDGFMLILGRSAQQTDFPDVPFPPIQGFGAARMHVQGLQVLVTPLAERRVRCEYVVHIDMRAPLPAPMLHFATQRVVGMIFHKLRKEAQRIRLGAASSAHAARMARDPHIYVEWMLPRMLEAISALGIERPPPAIVKAAVTAARVTAAAAPRPSTPDVMPTPSTSAVVAKSRQREMQLQAMQRYWDSQK